VNSAGSVKGAAELAALGRSKALSTNVDSTNVDALFDAGKVPFYITGPWSIDKAKKAGIKYAISSLPSLTSGGKMQPFLGIQMFYVSAKTRTQPSRRSLSPSTSRARTYSWHCSRPDIACRR
jgi:arabinogalactan oligomer / maltooligosaccharide transport system substrate-binding protein